MSCLRICALLLACLTAVSTSVEAGPSIEPAERAPSLRSSAKEVAAELLSAMKRGDAHAFVQRLDLRALYGEAVDQKGEAPEYAEFVENVEARAKAAFDSEPAEGFEYEITGSVVLVRVRVRHGEDDTWREHEIAFAEADGGWRITPEGMRQFDFGHGRGGPIARPLGPVQSAEAAAERLLEAEKKGDKAAVLDHLDLEGLYEIMVPEANRGKMTFAKFQKKMREEAEGHHEAPEGFDYEVLSSEVKDDVAVVTVKVKAHTNVDWKEYEVPFKQIDGKWKMTPGGLEKLAEQE
jgi:hypothetical protein